MTNFFLNIETIDVKILDYVQNHLRVPILNDLMKIVSILTKAGLIYILISLALIIIKRTRIIGITCALSLLIDVIVTNVLLKNTICRVRPYDKYSFLNIIVKAQKDFSFPSGHTAAAFAFFVVLFVILKKRYGVLALMSAMFLGFSRIYVGVHYPSDVLGGMIVGILCAIVSLSLVRKIIKDHPQIIDKVCTNLEDEFLKKFQIKYKDTSDSQVDQLEDTQEKIVNDLKNNQ